MMQATVNRPGVSAMGKDDATTEGDETTTAYDVAAMKQRCRIDEQRRVSDELK